MRSERVARRRVLIAVTAVTAACIVALLRLGVAGYGLTSSPPRSAVRHDAIAVTEKPAPATELATTSAAAGLPSTDDPVRYARAVTVALLTWDTATGLDVADHGWPVIADADPSGLETPSLAGDVARYLPDPQVWQQLRGYATAQTVTIQAAFVPDSWDAIAATAQGLRDGTVAVTVEATRHRAGVWQGQPATSDHPLAFTVFLGCPPAFHRCHTLRLSAPDRWLR